MGEACNYVPDITLMSFILFFGTYACSMALKQFKTSRFFPTTVSDGPLAESVVSFSCSFPIGSLHSRGVIIVTEKKTG